MMIAASAASMSENEPVAPERPNERRSANEVGEWHTREQLSMLLVPIAARISRAIAKQSSLVARDDASPAIASGPCSSLIAPRRVAIVSIASSQLASRRPSPERISGVVRRSGEDAKRWAKRPFRHAWPRLAGPSLAGVIESSWPFATWASRRHPTPQYPHVVATEDSEPLAHRLAPAPV